MFSKRQNTHRRLQKSTKRWVWMFELFKWWVRVEVQSNMMLNVVTLSYIRVKQNIVNNCISFSTWTIPFYSVLLMPYICHPLTVDWTHCKSKLSARSTTFGWINNYVYIHSISLSGNGSWYQFTWSDDFPTPPPPLVIHLHPYK